MCVVVMAVLTLAPPARSGPSELSPSQQRRVTPVVEVVRREAPGVVAIAATHVVTQELSIWDIFVAPSAVQRSSVGSGSVIHPSGYVLTNAHVVAMASEVSVVLQGGRELPAHVVASLPDEDVAVLRVDVPAGVSLQAVRLGRSDDVMVGETTIAIGNPVGLAHSVTSGIVSAVNRDIEPAAGVHFRVLQTDAAINPGNSGGPLFNILGEQIGVNTAIRSDAQNVGFAIPVDRVRALLPRLLSVEARGRAQLGVRVSRESDVNGPGVLIDDVVAGSPAAQAGLARGMVITDVAGTPTPTLVDALVALREQRPTVPFAVHVRLGDGQREALRVAVRDVPPPDTRLVVRAVLGVDVQDLDAELAARLGLRAGGAVVVQSVERGTDAARTGMRPGDLITRVGPHGVRRVEDLAFLEQVEAGARIALRVVRISRGRVVQSEVTLASRGLATSVRPPPGAR